MIYDNIIIGGGAAGLFCAANIASKGSTLLVESNRKLGIKLLASGAGQCNLTHGGDIKEFLDKYGDKGGNIRKLLYSFNNQKTVEYFEEKGIPIIEREDGKIFPKSLKSKDVCDLLQNEIRKKGITVRCGCKIVKLSRNEELYCIESESGEILKGRKVVVAVGGKSFPKTGSDGKFIYNLAENMGILLEDMYPSLVPIYIENYPFAQISGVSISDVEIKFEFDGKRKYKGDILFTHRNLSGPVIINNSRFLRPGMKLSINFIKNFMDINGFKEEDIRKFWKDKMILSKSTRNIVLEAFSLPRAFVTVFLDQMVASDVLNEKDLSEKPKTLGEKKFMKILNHLLSWDVTVSGSESFDRAMATFGGVSLKDIEMKTMEHKKHPKLYFIGECLDVDGDTGGYNIQFAFSTAYRVAQQI